MKTACIVLDIGKVVALASISDIDIPRIPVRTLDVLMAAWYHVSCEQLCDHIRRCLGTALYQDKLLEHDISGESFFNLSSKEEWGIFYSCIGMKSFQHMMKLTKWVGECKERSCIVFESKPEVFNPPPSGSFKESSNNPSLEKVHSKGSSASDSVSCVVQQQVSRSFIHSSIPRSFCALKFPFTRPLCTALRIDGHRGMDSMLLIR